MAAKAFAGVVIHSSLFIWRWSRNHSATRVSGAIYHYEVACCVVVNFCCCTIIIIVFERPARVPCYLLEFTLDFPRNQNSTNALMWAGEKWKLFEFRIVQFEKVIRRTYSCEALAHDILSSAEVRPTKIVTKTYITLEYSAMKTNKIVCTRSKLLTHKSLDSLENWRKFSLGRIKVCPLILMRTAITRQTAPQLHISPLASHVLEHADEGISDGGGRARRMSGRETLERIHVWLDRTHIGA